MYTVKITNGYDNIKQPLVNQTPQKLSTWGDYKFCIDDDNVTECDYWVILEDLNKIEKVKCHLKNIIFIPCEPPNIKTYQDDFLLQFGNIATFRDNFKFGKIYKYHQCLPWFVMKTYDELKNYQPAKKKLLSVVCSNKSYTSGHKARLDFAIKLKEYFKDDIDFFGTGFNFIEDKLDAIADYKYHIVIENERWDGYWTEKLADAFLGEAYPFYYGANDINEYFEQNSLTKIDINNFDLSVNMIKTAINNNFYENNISSIRKAKEDIIDKYNIFASISDICSNIKLQKANNLIELRPLEQIKRKSGIRRLERYFRHYWVLK